MTVEPSIVSQVLGFAALAVLVILLGRLNEWAEQRRGRWTHGDASRGDRW